MVERDWHNLYSDGWRNEIVPDAFAHPAKFARGLIRRIYAHCLEQGYFQPGDVILDPFGGVALGGLDAALNGLHWLGVELEEKFVTLGNQNVNLWNDGAAQRAAWGIDGWGSVRLVQGDSRYLAQVLSEAGGVVSSPPYADGAQHTGGETRMTSGQGGLIRFVDYGNSEAQLGNLPEGSHAAVVSSPPYVESVNQSDGANDATARIERKAQAGIDIGHKPNVGGPNSVLNRPQVYGDSAGQLGAMRVVSSPPFEQSDMRKGGSNLAKDWAIQHGRNPDGPSMSAKTTIVPYGSSDNNLANSQGDDFWTAARQIMQQVALLLPAEAVAVWVCKRFVKNKQIVDFSRQWADLGEACGFETVEWIRAWLIEDRGAQYDMFGELHEQQVARKSFFRRLYESKYPENSIDWEDVIIQRRRG